jgi:uncharacterized small protein (DUF1192 family)
LRQRRNGVARVKLPANFASMSVDELWDIYEELVELLQAKILAEKAMLERQKKNDDKAKGLFRNYRCERRLAV